MQLDLNRQDIKEVVVILAGSRTGSSFLYDQLASTGHFLCPQGEETPYYRLAGIGLFTEDGYSDEIHTVPDANKLNQAGKLLLADSGINTTDIEDPELFFHQILFRAKLRFPILSFAENSLARKEIVSLLQAHRENWEALYPALWHSLAELSLGLGFGAEEKMDLPIIEEPPWIQPVPKKRIAKEDIGNYPLLLKTSTNCLRIPLIRAMYPLANIRWIVLHRNPAATISALIDGWQSPNFQSYYLPQHLSLQIEGYSNKIIGGDRFWKFDLPPGWQKFRNKNIYEVCSHQYQSSYSAIAKFQQKCVDPMIETSYENLCAINSNEQISKVLSFALNREVQTRSFATNRLAMTVSPPQAGKWKKRQTEIEFYLRHFDNGILLDLAEKYRYPLDRISEWN